MKHMIIGNGPTDVVGDETLRQHDPRSTITLIGDERAPPRIVGAYLARARATL